MKRCLIQHSLTKITLAAVAAAVTLLAAAPAHANTSWCRGGMWASTGGEPDNVVYPDGITSSTTPTQAAAVADAVANDYHLVGINFVRIDVDPATVSSPSNNWAVVQSYVNELVTDGLYVDICCSYNNANGEIENTNTWKTCWQTIDGVYKNNGNVYYEPLNEPQYTLSGLESVYTTFLNTFSIAKGHSFIILDGVDAAADVTGIGAYFTDCSLAIHCYVGPNCTTESCNETGVANAVGSCANRTFVTEFGSPTTTGLNYQVSSSQTNIAFMRGVCIECRALPMGTMWFPAHQNNGNNKRMFTGIGGDIFNRSALNEVQYSWDFFTTVEAPGCDINVIGTTDYAIYRTNSSTGTFFTYPGTGGIQYGANTDIAVPADYNGTGQAQLSVWRPNGGYWYVYPSLSPTQYGQSGDIPVPADYLGNGSAQMAVWRPSNGTWYVSGGGSQQWGTSGDIPVPGYYKNDGHVDYAVYRPSNNTWNIYGWSAITFGQAGDIPVPGDYTGSGTTQIAMFRPSNGNWYVYGVGITNFGINGDVPVPGDYAGAGFTQMATWVPTNFVWSVDGVGTTTYGTTGDVPLPLPYAIRHYSLGYNN